MSFVFLCGGQGKRFQDFTPCRKPNMLIYGLPMYEWVIDSITNSIINNNIKLHMVIQDDSIGKSVVGNIIRKYKNVESTCVRYNTRGPAETCMLCVNDKLRNQHNESFWVLDNDILFDKSIDWQIKMDVNELYVIVQDIEDVLEKNKYSPYSHVIIDDNNNITDIVEKIYTSKHIVLGAYGFGSPEIYKKVFDIFLQNKELTQAEWFMSSLIKTAIISGITVKAVRSKNSISIGTPDQLEDALINNMIISKPLRWVFDLDETLVTLPSLKGDYSTVSPIIKVIRFVQYLYKTGHYIIIYTARHMKTCNNNIKEVIDRIDMITKDTLNKYEIPYNELVFGKPYGDIYVDDKSTNPLHWQNGWMTGSIGFGWDKHIEEVYHDNNKIININDDLCYKIALNDEGLGNKYFIDKCPKYLIPLIPHIYDMKVISETHVKILMEWKNDSIPIGKLLAYDMLDKDIFLKVLDLLKLIHSNSISNNLLCSKSDVMMNYYPKLEERMNIYKSIYSTFDLNIEVIKTFFDLYDPDITSCIHGDFWLSNLLWSHKNKKIYMIDMRGRLGNKLSISGDKFYDYAKLMQSLLGFDILVHGSKSIKYNDHINIFIEYFNLNEDDINNIKKLTAFLILGSIPFHSKLDMNEVKIIVSELWPTIIL